MLWAKKVEQGKENQDVQGQKEDQVAVLSKAVRAGLIQMVIFGQRQ